MELLGVVNKEPGLLAVTLGEVIGRDLQRLIDPLANGDTRDHHDELGPAVALVHLEDGFDVAVGLTGAGLHLNVQIDVATGTFHQRVRHGQVLPSLDVADIGRAPGDQKVGCRHS